MEASNLEAIPENGGKLSHQFYNSMLIETQISINVHCLNDTNIHVKMVPFPLLF